MGLFTALLTVPLAPVRGVVWVADQLAEAADREVNDPAAVRAQLADLNQALEDGQIDLAAFEREEDRLLDRLEAAVGPEVARD
ncbi:gas vesicle protein GvpG [Streptomyces sp. NPDC052207]|uniref:gas vesicle protein GvpG n=1 Tax=Streptomyces sp. NPDC052207 TaxID=3155418 RepID=UPI003416BE97